MSKQTDLLIIGAGPFGLSMSAYCKHHNIDHIIVGKPMDFWKSNMPKGMYLRSGVDWHLDPAGIHTIESYLKANGLATEDVSPLSLDFYLGYVKWFRQRKRIEPVESFVSKLDFYKSNNSHFVAEYENGEVINAKNVLLTLGFKHFKNIPPELSQIFPKGRYTHTCDLVEFDEFKNKRCLIIGGRQSAFEWAALLNEAGASKVYVSHRHDTPTFTESDWSWVLPLLNKIVENPEWFRNLSDEERKDLDKRFWIEGRLKLEPWLCTRINNESIKILPNTQALDCTELSNNELEVTLDNGEKLIVDHIVLATGYKVDMSNVPLLKQGNILEHMKIKNGFPVLDIHLQTNIPGLFVTSMAATQDFGFFFAFTVSVNASAKIVGGFLRDNQ